MERSPIIRKYQLDGGKVPYDNWFNKLKDKRAKAKIEIRLKRLELGNFGDCKSLGNGIHELRITEGQAYRVYFGQKDKEVILLLCGGDKSTQHTDIKLAKQYWRNYNAE